MFRMFMVLVVTALGCSSAVSEVSTTTETQTPVPKYVPTDAEQKLVDNSLAALMEPHSCQVIGKALAEHSQTLISNLKTCNDSEYEQSWCTGAENAALAWWSLYEGGFKDRCGDEEFRIFFIYGMMLNKATHDCCTYETWAAVEQILLRLR